MSNIHGPNMVTNGIVACWDVGNRVSYPGAGTTITDLVGSSNGTLTNGPTFDSANLGSIDFDGANDYIDVGNASSLQITSAITLAAWYRTSSAGNDTLVAKFSADGSQKAYKLRMNSSTMRAVFSANGSSNTVRLEDPSDTDDNVWHYAVATNDGTGASDSALLYIDGVLVNYATGTATIYNSTANVYIGDQDEDGNPQPYEGLLAHVAIYNIALSASEVSQNYNALKGRFGL